MNDAFGAPINLQALNSPDVDAGPHISDDELTLLFSSSRAGGSGGTDIYRATRASKAVPFGAPVNLTAINQSGLDGGPELSADGLTMFFATARSGGLGGTDLWKATRASTSVDFVSANAVHLSAASSASQEWSPALMANGVIYFESNRPGSSDYDLYETKPGAGGDYGSAVRIDALSTSDADYSPAFAFGGKHIYFSSSRPPNLGSGDMWMAKCLN